MIPIGKGGERPIEDYKLSRYACYLIVQNGDPAKPIIALGQTYFALQTRRQELDRNSLLNASISALKEKADELNIYIPPREVR